MLALTSRRQRIFPINLNEPFAIWLYLCLRTKVQKGYIASLVVSRVANMLRVLTHSDSCSLRFSLFVSGLFPVRLLFILHDTDVPVRFHEGLLDLFQVVDPLLAHLAQQLLF